jgi:SAM-dependent methyltransferase
MIRFDPSSSPPFGSDFLLWGGSFFLVVALHVVAVVGLQPDRSEGEAAGDPAVIIELETDSAAPLQGRSELTPGPEQVQTDQISQASVAQQEVVQRTQKEEEASPPKVDIATAPDPEVELPDVRDVPDVKPDEEKQKEKDTEKQQQNPSEAHLESVPTAAPQAEAVVAPQVTISAGAPVEDVAALITWRARLAARRLGAKVHSFDYDPRSVACTAELRRRYFTDDPDWRVEQGSALDPDYLKSLGTFDVVYSWGVLHHTGDMWRAVDNAAGCVRQGGLLYISIYNRADGFALHPDGRIGPSGLWAFEKRAYNRLPIWTKRVDIVRRRS